MSHKRRHHNTKGYRQIKNGKPAKQMRNLAEALGVPYGQGASDEVVLDATRELMAASDLTALVQADLEQRTKKPR